MGVTLSEEQFGRIVAALIGASDGLAAMTAGANLAAESLAQGVAVVNEVREALGQGEMLQKDADAYRPNRQQRRAAKKAGPKP